MTQPFTIVSLAAVAWDFPLVGRTRMLSEAWQRLGQNTLFVEAPHSWRTQIKGAVSPHEARAVPTIRPRASYPVRFWGNMNERRIRDDMIRRARNLRKELDAHIDWQSSVALVVSPAWAPWFDDLPFAKIIYDCIDHLSVHAPQAGLLALFEQWERELIARSSAAIVTADVLAAHVTSIRNTLPVKIIRNGVEAARFQSPSTRPADLPARQPLVGFIGALYEWIDYQLIESCARAHPECTFVFIGPADQPDKIHPLQSLSNVRLLGPRVYEQVPNYLSSFDICWVPFNAKAISAAANPIKIYEYLAAGKPVITTAVADTNTFNDLVRVVGNVQQFSAALADLLPDSPERQAPRRAFAAKNDWSHRAADVVEFIKSLP